MVSGKDNPRPNKFLGRFSWVLPALVLGFFWSQNCLAAQAPTDTLILVNGEPITVSDFDQLVMQAHQNVKMEEAGENLAGRLLEKRVKDILLIQDALAAGMGEDPDFVADLEDKEFNYAIQEYVKDNLVLPEEASPDLVRSHFERYYWQIQFRQLSVRTLAGADSMRTAVLAGADMDSLAKVHSLDTKKLNGGLHNLLYWADVENIFRDQVRTLEEGQLSGVFPVNQAYAFLRVEKRLPLNEAAFPQFQKKIAALVLGQQRQEAWDAFVAEKGKEVALQEDAGIIMSVLADSAMVLESGFQKNQPANIIEVKDGRGISGTVFREKLAYAYKVNKELSFALHFHETRDVATAELILGELAVRNGYLEKPNVAQRVNEDWEKGLLELYLAETVVPKIVFSRQEFQEFYDLNQDNFRGPDEVRLDILILEKESDAQEASRRLQEGADFGRVFQEYNHGQELGPTRPKFIKETELSQAIKDALETMEPGNSSPALKMGMGYMVFRLDAKRPGAVPPLGMVEMEIRQVLYQKKFNQVLNENLDLLLAASDVQRWPDRIEQYFQPIGGDQ